MKQNRVKLYIFLVRKNAITEELYPNWIDLWFSNESKIVQLFNKMTSKKYFTLSIEKFFELYACDLYPNSKYCNGPVTTTDSKTSNDNTSDSVDNSNINSIFSCVYNSKILKGISKSLNTSDTINFKLSSGSQLQFNTDKSFVYISRNDPDRKIMGTWECNGPSDFIANTENNARLDSKKGYWEYDVIHKSTNENAPTTSKSINIKIGSSGSEVTELQNLLIKNGYKNISKIGKPDGIFGKRTLSSVKDFQSSNKDKKGNPLKVTGIVDDSTMEALKRKKLQENIIKKVLKRNLEMENK